MNTKFATLLFFCSLFFILGCQDQQTSSGEKSICFIDGYSHVDHEVDGMTYRVFYKTRLVSETGYSIFAINITKDKLEVELLKKQLGVNSSNGQK